MTVSFLPSRCMVPVMMQGGSVSLMITAIPKSCKGLVIALVFGLTESSSLPPMNWYFPVLGAQWSKILCWWSITTGPVASVAGWFFPSKV